MNKNIKLFVLLVATSFVGFAQIGIGTTTPETSSALDISATDKGFLMPRMTTAERTAISSPATGLQAYDTDTKSVWIFDGTVWKEGVGGAGKFVDGATPDIAYYDGKVGIGINNFSNVHQLYVKKEVTTDSQVTTSRIDGTYNGTGISPATYALGAVVRNANTGTIDFAIATQGIIQNPNAGGTINNATATWPQLYNSGTINFATGITSSITNSGTIVTGVASSSDITNNAGKTITDAFAGFMNISNEGTITNGYGLYLDYFSTAGTITNSYGLYISDAFNKGTADNFAIYSASNADSYVEGNLGVGTNNPQQKIHISGAMRLEPQATAPTGALGDLYVNTDGKLYFHNGTAWKEVQLVP